MGHSCESRNLACTGINLDFSLHRNDTILFLPYSFKRLKCYLLSNFLFWVAFTHYFVVFLSVKLFGFPEV